MLDTLAVTVVLGVQPLAWTYVRSPLAPSCCFTCLHSVGWFGHLTDRQTRNSWPVCQGLGDVKSEPAAPRGEAGQPGVLG